MARKLALIAALAGILLSAAAFAPREENTLGYARLGAGTLSMSGAPAYDQAGHRS